MSKPNTNNKGKTEFPPSVGFWPAKSDANKFTVFIDENIKAQIAKAEVGGRLLLTKTPKERLEKNSKIAHFQVTIFAPDQDAFQGKRQEADEGGL